MKLKYLGLIIIGSIIFAGCSQQADTTENTPADSETAADTTGTLDTMEAADVTDDAMEADDAMMAEGEATQMTIDMFSFGYSEMELTGKPGETFEITLTNSGGNHDFDIDELNVDSEVIGEGETTSVTFTIPEDAEPGTEYAYYCSVGNHRAQGMEGTLTVE